MNFKNLVFKFSLSIVSFIATIVITTLCYDKPYKLIAFLPFSYMVVNFL